MVPPMNWREHIISDPEICHGKPCFIGTRIMVSVILDCLAEGLSEDDIMAEYPSLSRADIRSALAFSADLTKDPTFAA